MKSLQVALLLFITLFSTLTVKCMEDNTILPFVPEMLPAIAEHSDFASLSSLGRTCKVYCAQMPEAFRRCSLCLDEDKHTDLLIGTSKANNEKFVDLLMTYENEENRKSRERVLFSFEYIGVNAEDDEIQSALRNRVWTMSAYKAIKSGDVAPDEMHFKQIINHCKIVPAFIFIKNIGIDSFSDSHYDAFFFAIIKDDKNFVLFLINNGFNVNAQNPLKRTVLSLALQQCKNEIADLLKEHGAERKQ